MVIRTDLPDLSSEADLHELVKTYQIHRHSKTCRKYRNEKCNFIFVNFLLVELSLQNLCQILYQLTIKMR